MLSPFVRLCLWSGVWIGLALLFDVFVYFTYEYRWFGLGHSNNDIGGHHVAVLFLTGYLVEQSLSGDNVLVIAMIFTYFGISPAYQHRVLFWGIFGALTMRAIMILIGTTLIAKFNSTLYLFGAFLLFSGAKMFFVRDGPNETRPALLRLARWLLPIADDYVGQQLIVQVNGTWVLTPLALALAVVEISDLMFAVDSIPAVFAITDDPFLVFSSNAMAMLGLRSLYFALAGIMPKFHFLKPSLALILTLVGLKLLLKDVLGALPGLSYYTLGAVAIIFAGGLIASFVRDAREVAQAPATKRKSDEHTP